MEKQDKAIVFIVALHVARTWKLPYTIMQQRPEMVGSTPLHGHKQVRQGEMNATRDFVVAHTRFHAVLHQFVALIF
jgi:hypothetical protein